MREGGIYVKSAHRFLVISGGRALEALGPMGGMPFPVQGVLLALAVAIAAAGLLMGLEGGHIPLLVLIILCLPARPGLKPWADFLLGLGTSASELS